MWRIFSKNAGTACGKPNNRPFYNGLPVPERLGTSLGQVGTNRAELSTKAFVIKSLRKSRAKTVPRQ